MEKTDSTSALMSLGAYGDDVDDDIDDGDDGDDVDTEGIDNISGSDDENIKYVERAPDKEAEKRQASASPLDFLPKPAKMERKATRLVSYGADDIDEDAEDAEDSEEKALEEKYDVSSIEMMNVAKDQSFNSDVAASLSRSVQDMEADDIKLPPEPQGKCSRKLQEKIVGFYEKRSQYEQGNGRYQSINEIIQQRKDFRNPSIYEKLITYINIDEKGTNYPPEIYDPTIMGPESYYDELAKIQKVEMDRREKEKKDRTKVNNMIEFVTVTKKIDVPGEQQLKRKSKWDAQPSVVPAGSIRPAVVPPTVLNPSVISVSATGTKTTVISAVGTIAKKPSK